MCPFTKEKCSGSHAGCKMFSDSANECSIYILGISFHDVASITKESHAEQKKRMEEISKIREGNNG